MGDVEKEEQLIIIEKAGCEEKYYPDGICIFMKFRKLYFSIVNILTELMPVV
jgi:hypothetical protein